MADENKVKRGLFSGWIPKILILVGVILVVSVAFFGVELTLPGIIAAIIKIVVGVGLIIVLAKGIMSFVEITKAPPKKRMLDIIKRLAKIQKPYYLKEVHIRGEDMRLGFKWGAVKGLLFIPNLAGKPVVDAKGHYVFTEKLDRSGKIIKNRDGEPIMIHKFGDLEIKDGEWLIVAKRGWWIFAQEDLIRAHYDLVSEIGHEVVIKTTNLLNINGFLFPTQQWQTDIVRLNVQHQAEIAFEAQESFWDMLEHLASRGVAANPELKKSQLLNTESMGDAPRQ
jgi:hypothetical protein